ncbi:aminotransferase class I/II-fold pyridoxal phosphate-dependent enzyme [Kurthia massiliensis]|uniref:aminotransferase class I/II-fold pyridoxal phosphate-dependent enzyme n=1 Tax=Kurthia massiliensis TaxID=1033739 RepID=UPI0002887E45|nr:aminotransferase class I/II-fold pyridoxal phosphate-dependent enzyme [Kurthia massiliensis]
MHKLAAQLNDTLQQQAPTVLDMLSNLGKEMYYPTEGILAQSAEAKSAKKYNATIGTALENGKPMHLKVIQDTLSAYEPKDLYLYAPPQGKAELRQAWREKMIKENPSLVGKTFGTPIVTNALTHGLSIIADLFADNGDALIIPDKNWENYDMVFGIRRGANVVTYPLYDDAGLFNATALKETIIAQKDATGKAIVLLNFPNNPTGYTPTPQEADTIVQAIKEAADTGVKVVAVTDDAYFSLFFEDSITESLFGRLADVHENVLAVKIDGATKEEYVWGFRVGFITYAAKNEAILHALEEKTRGIIRATISSGPHPSQTFVLKALQSPEFEQQKQEKFDIMKGRAIKTKQVLDSGKYDDAWDYYPFNSGYFMCLKLKNVTADELRPVALEKYGVGAIALGETDLRVAFSCIEEDGIEELFDLLYAAVKDVEASK